MEIMEAFGSGNVPKSSKTSEDFYDLQSTENTVRNLSCQTLLWIFLQNSLAAAMAEDETMERDKLLKFMPYLRKVCGQI